MKTSLTSERCIVKEPSGAKKNRSKMNNWPFHELKRQVNTSCMLGSTDYPIDKRGNQRNITILPEYMGRDCEGHVDQTISVDANSGASIVRDR